MSSRARVSSRALRRFAHRGQAARGICISVVIALFSGVPIPGMAQRADSSCTYTGCSLNIVPRLTGLDVVLGNGENRVASLAFLFPHHVASAFISSDAATRHADAAFSRRRIAAVLTDAGVVLLASAATHAVTPARRGAVGAAGLALVAGSVPIHFAADAELSRAVWEFNRQFAR